MNMYQAEYVQQTYNLSKHMGFYYELGAHKNLRYSMRAKTHVLLLRGRFFRIS